MSSGLSRKFLGGIIAGTVWDKHDGFISFLTPDLHPVSLKTSLSKDEECMKEWESTVAEGVVASRADLYLRNVASGEYDLIASLDSGDTWKVPPQRKFALTLMMEPNV